MRENSTGNRTATVNVASVLLTKTLMQGSRENPVCHPDMRGGSPNLYKQHPIFEEQLGQVLLS